MAHHQGLRVNLDIPRYRRLHLLILAVFAMPVLPLVAEENDAAKNSAKPPVPQVAQQLLGLKNNQPVTLPDGNVKLALNLNRALSPADGRVTAIVSAVANTIERRDVSTILSVAGDVLEIDFAAWPLQPEAYTVAVYQVGLDGRWRLMGQVNIVVAPNALAIAPPSAATTSSAPQPITLRLDVGTTAQLQETVGGSQRASARQRYANLNIQGSVSTAHEGEDWEIKSQIQLAGGSFRQQAPNVSVLGTRAPKLDIASYLVDAAWRDTRVNIGHISVDSHPLLMSGISNRGIALLQKLPLGIDLGVTVQNGESVVGYRNLAGLSNDKNQFRSVGLGYDFYRERPGVFRLDVNSLDARVQSGGQFGQPITVDESRGNGARLLWRNDASTLRLEAVYAKSTFHNGNAPQNFAATVNGNSRTLEAGYDVITNKALTPTLPLTITTGLRHEYSSPLFRSLGAGFQANYQMHVGSVTTKLGALTAQLQLTRRHDNVNSDVLYMRNKVDASSFNVSLPISQFFGNNLDKSWALATKTSPDETPKNLSWLPTLTFSQQIVHGYGDAHIIPAGYGVDDLPNVMITNRALGLQWQFERVSFGLRANNSDQDNQQLGFQHQSTWDKRYSANLDWRVTDALSLNLAYDPTYNYRFDANTRSDARQLRGGLSWSISDTLQLTSDINHSADFDNIGSRYNRQNTSQVQLAKRFNVNIPGWKKLPGQTYLRITESRGFNFSQGSPVLEPTVRRIQLGMTLTVF
jgi:hypothetical protein